MHKGGSHLHEQWLPFLEVWERPEGGETASYAVTPLHQEVALGKPVARSHSGSIPVCDGCFLKGEVSGWRLGGASVGRWCTTTMRFTPVLRSLTALPSAPRSHIWVQYVATPQAQVPSFSFRVAEGRAGGLEFTLLCERHPFMCRRKCWKSPLQSVLR